MAGKKQTALSQAQDEITHLRQMVRELMGQLAARPLTMTSVNGHSPIPTRIVANETASGFAPEIEEAIEQYAGQSPNAAAARKGFQRYVARMSASGKSVDEIVVGIHKGGDGGDDEDE